jgi:hypothetical protein
LACAAEDEELSAGSLCSRSINACNVWLESDALEALVLPEVAGLFDEPRVESTLKLSGETGAIAEACWVAPT